MAQPLLLARRLVHAAVRGGAWPTANHHQLAVGLVRGSAPSTPRRSTRRLLSSGSSQGSLGALNEDIVALATAVDVEHIRNFSIIAHVDHGKSTLADRLLVLTGRLKEHDHLRQTLDTLKVEQERGITVKSQTASLLYTYRSRAHRQKKDGAAGVGRDGGVGDSQADQQARAHEKHDGEKYLINLIDTPGHHDFNFEVGRSLQACQGALLLVDASQGIQAQTLANFHICTGLRMKVIPVITKLDLPNARPEDIKDQLELVLGFERSEILCTSAKTGLGVEEILPAIVERVPHPLARAGDYVDGTPPAENPYNARLLKALLFDSWFDRCAAVTRARTRARTRTRARCRVPCLVHLLQ